MNRLREFQVFHPLFYHRRTPSRRRKRSQKAAAARTRTLRTMTTTSAGWPRCASSGASCMPRGSSSRTSSEAAGSRTETPTSGLAPAPQPPSRTHPRSRPSHRTSLASTRSKRAKSSAALATWLENRSFRSKFLWQALKVCLGKQDMWSSF